MIAIASDLVRRPAPAHDDVESDRELYRYAAMLGRAGNLRRPRFPAPLRKRWPAEMIDHDFELRQPNCEVEHGFELRRVDGNGVEGKPRRGQQLERLEDALLQHPARVRFVADEMAHADEFPARAQPLERARGGVGIGERQPADDAAHEVDVFADVETLLGLATELMQDLDQHCSRDAAAGELRAQVVRREIAGQALADPIRPGIGVAPRPPEMMMRVDHDRSNRQACPRRLSSLITALLSKSPSPCRTQASKTSAWTSSSASGCRSRCAWSSMRCTSLRCWAMRPSAVISPRIIFEPFTSMTCE